MIDIKNHPIWKGSPLWGSVNPLKKRGHLFRFFLARHFAKLFPRSRFIGITGSVGKTTTVAACLALLKEKFEVIATSPDLDPIFNIPITILKLRPKIKKVILEMGIQYPGEMEFYLSMVKPYTGIVTRFGLQHSSNLGTLDEIIDEKAKLIEQLPKEGYAILNYDDPRVRKLSERTKAQVIYYGSDPKNCHVWFGKQRLQDFKTVFELNYGVERVLIRSKLLGFHQIYPLAAAAALGISCDMSLTTIKKGLEKVESSPHRLQALAGYNGSTILDDTHNAAPIAVEEALETLNHVPARRRIVILGEMKELGDLSEKMHRGVARKIYKDKIDLVFLGTGDAEFIKDELLKLGFIPERIQSNLQNPQIVAQLLKILVRGDIVLIKGARSVRLDEVVQRVIKKS